MRRRWRLRPDLDWDLVVPAMWALWTFGGLLILCIVSFSTDGGDISKMPSIVVAALWAFGIVGVPVIVGTALGFRWLWRHPPFERVTESVEDMREAHRQ